MFHTFSRLKREQCYNVSHFGRFRAFIPRAMFLVNVAHLRLVTLQIRRMLHTFASVSRRDECFTLSSLSGLCRKCNVCSWSPLKFDECFTLSRGRYPTMTNVSHSRRYLFCQCVVELFGFIRTPPGKLELQHTTSDPRPTRREIFRDFATHMG